MPKLTDLIEAYLESKANSWSASTLRSERSRFAGVTMEMLSQPTKLYEHLKDVRALSPYALKTTFTRVGELAEFAILTGKLAAPNRIKAYMKENARSFKHVYQKKHLALSFEQAIEAIKRIDDKDSQAKAIELLFAGMRWAESQTLHDGQVTAKGGHMRDVPLAQGVKHVQYEANYTTFYRHLKKVGLTPHMLRKLCATKAVELGATVPDLMRLFGWTNSNTAMIYVQAQKERELADAMTKLLPKENSDGKQVSKKVPAARARRPATTRKPNAR